jgi:ATP-dependent Lhr-like helicase
LEDVFKYVPLAKVEKILTQAVLQVPLFPIRWRWDASRALAILRFTNGKKTPPPLVRMRSDDLLAAVFPEQVMCQDNAMPGDVEIPDHPLVFETMRDALHEAMDIDGFKRVLEDISSGEVEILARDTTQPSVFSHQILNAMPYAFLDEDGEIGERRSRAVALRRALPTWRRLTWLLSRARLWTRGRSSAMPTSCTMLC